MQWINFFDSERSKALVLPVYGLRAWKIAFRVYRGRSAILRVSRSGRIRSKLHRRNVTRKHPKSSGALMLRTERTVLDTSCELQTRYAPGITVRLVQQLLHAEPNLA